MRIFHNRGENTVTLGLTAIKFDNKINSIQKYDKREMNSIIKRFKKKGENIRSVVISYTWGYKTKEPSIYYSRIKFPLGNKITPKNLLHFASIDMEEKHGYYLEKESDEVIQPGESKPRSYFLREVSFLFIGESEKKTFTENKPKKTKEYKEPIQLKLPF